jgi:hypothetical protein
VIWLVTGGFTRSRTIKRIVPGRLGAPDYPEFMRREEGRSWRTKDHKTRAEYQSLFKDLVLESKVPGDAEPNA